MSQTDLAFIKAFTGGRKPSRRSAEGKRPVRLEPTETPQQSPGEEPQQSATEKAVPPAPSAQVPPSAKPAQQADTAAAGSSAEASKPEDSPGSQGSDSPPEDSQEESNGHQQEGSSDPDGPAIEAVKAPAKESELQQTEHAISGATEETSEESNGEPRQDTHTQTDTGLDGRSSGSVSPSEEAGGHWGFDRPLITEAESQVLLGKVTPEELSGQADAPAEVAVLENAPAATHSLSSALDAAVGAKQAQTLAKPSLAAAGGITLPDQESPPLKTSVVSAPSDRVPATENPRETGDSSSDATKSTGDSSHEAPSEADPLQVQPPTSAQPAQLNPLDQPQKAPISPPPIRPQDPTTAQPKEPAEAKVAEASQSENSSKENAKSTEDSNTQGSTPVAKALGKNPQKSPSSQRQDRSSRDGLGEGRRGQVKSMAGKQADEARTSLAVSRKGGSNSAEQEPSDPSVQTERRGQSATASLTLLAQKTRASGVSGWQPVQETERFVLPPVCDALIQAVGDRFDELAKQIAPPGEQKVLMVVSVQGNEGCSTVACCLARTLAAAGRKAVLVDHDLTNPHLSEALGLTLTTGWEGVLTGQTALAEAVIQATEESLAVLPLAGALAAPVAADVVPRMRLCFGLLRQHYEVVLLDAGPVESVTDDQLAQPRADAALIVCDPATDSESRLRKVADRLSAAGMEVLGLAETFVTAPVKATA